MKPEKFLGFVTLLGLVCSCTGQASDIPCPGEGDAVEQLTMFDSPNERHDLRQTQFLESNEIADIGGDFIEEFKAALSMSNIERAVNGTPAEIKIVGDQKPESASALDVAVAYYHRVCPHWWYLIRRYQWYWRVWTWGSNGITIDYWFTYWWVWATWCPHRYCSVYYFPFQYKWDPRYRCYPEYRVVWLPMVCYRVTIIDGKVVGKWTKWTWRRVYIPRGCCCRRYWYWLSVNANTCPVKELPSR